MKHTLKSLIIGPEKLIRYSMKGILTTRRVYEVSSRRSSREESPCRLGRLCPSIALLADASRISVQFQRGAGTMKRMTLSLRIVTAFTALLFGVQVSAEEATRLPDTIEKIKSAIVAIGTFQKTRRPPEVFRESALWSPMGCL